MYPNYCYLDHQYKIFYNNFGQGRTLREVLEVLGTVENLVRHVKTLLREIKYIEVNS